MTTPLALLILLAPAAMALVAIPGAGNSPIGRLGTTGTRLGVLVAIASAAYVAVEGATSSPTLGGAGLGLSVRLDAVSTIMLIMIALLGVVLWRYSSTYLSGDPRRPVFLRRLALALAAVELLVISGNLATLVFAWIATSLALHQLLRFHPNRPRAIIAARKKWIVARIGDVMLILAALLLYRSAGTGDLATILDEARTATDNGAAALALALAAALKSAQFPTHGWLIEMMETPTPVSALLHAGILNAGPFLAIRMAYVLDSNGAATTALIIIGGTTALFASVALLTQPSIKVVLAYSSAAHMGFMLMVCGLGVYPAALLHLVAHSFYKAHAFLSSGSVVDELRTSGVSLPRRLGSPGRILASAVIATGMYVAVATIAGIDLLDRPAVAALGLCLVLGTTQIIAPAVDSARPGAAGLRAAGLALAVTLAFFTLETATHYLLGDTVPYDGARDAAHLIATGLVLLAFTGAVILQILEPARGRSPRRAALAVHMRNGLYANAMFDRLIGAQQIPTPEASR